MTDTDDGADAQRRDQLAAVASRESARPSSPKLERRREAWAAEIEKIDAAEVDVIVMGADDARGITAAIRTGLEQMWELLARAYAGRVWVALDYGSWSDYCDAEFGTGGRLAIPRGERTTVVNFLRDAGMSVRAIAAATGISKDTAHRALDEAGVSNETADSTTVDEVTGLDGKRHPARKKPPAEPEPAVASTTSSGETAGLSENDNEPESDDDDDEPDEDGLRIAFFHWRVGESVPEEGVSITALLKWAKRAVADAEKLIDRGGATAEHLDRMEEALLAFLGEFASVLGDNEPDDEEMQS